MSPWMWWAIALVVLILVWGVTASASRLDRLHHRIARSFATLDAQLVRRASAALDLVRLGMLDPASALVIADIAGVALDAGPVTTPERELAESELSRALRTALEDSDLLAKIADDEIGSAVLASLASASVRVGLVRRFHNDAVTHARRIRQKFTARILRLAGRAPMPVTIELDDGLPAHLGEYDVRVGP